MWRCTGQRRGRGRVCDEGRLALVLAAILEPYRHGLGLPGYFFFIPVSAKGKKEKGSERFSVQIELLGERFALFARRVRGAMEELLEHGELGTSEPLAGALRACGRI